MFEPKGTFHRKAIKMLNWKFATIKTWNKSTSDRYLVQIASVILFKSLLTAAFSDHTHTHIFGYSSQRLYAVLLTQTTLCYWQSLAAAAIRSFRQFRRLRLILLVHCGAAATLVATWYIAFIYSDYRTAFHEMMSYFMNNFKRTKSNVGDATHTIENLYRLRSSAIFAYANDEDNIYLPLAHTKASCAAFHARPSAELNTYRR